MPARLKRRIALILLGLLAFAQVNVALAGCFMDRASMMPASAASSDMVAPCDGCNVPVSDSSDQISNGCLVHCTSDLQLTGDTRAVVLLDVVDIPVLLVPRVESPPLPRKALDGPPVAAPPRRILLHSFLV
jgi:hypothetical protein